MANIHELYDCLRRCHTRLELVKEAEPHTDLVYDQIQIILDDISDTIYYDSEE